MPDFEADVPGLDDPRVLRQGHLDIVELPHQDLLLLLFFGTYHDNQSRDYRVDVPDLDDPLVLC
jgi:hypothetical protein